MPNRRASFSSGDSDSVTGSSKQGNAGYSPRALATREKNREAVRKCRQRKRERTEELKQRCEELSRENVRLRMRLELGNEEASQEKVAKGRQLIFEMQRLLRGLEGKLADKERSPQKDALDAVYQQFFERHIELGPDKLASIGFVVKRLHGLIQPDPLTKAYLFLLSLDDDSFDDTIENPTDGAKWWRKFCQELGLTEEQKRQISLRRLTGQRAKAELFYVAQRAQSMSKAIVERKHLTQSFMEMMRGFTQAQMAKYIVWVSTDPCGNELLDMLWSELISAIDADLDRERAQHENDDVRAHEVQQLLNAVRHENGRLFKTLFECGDIQDSFRNARRIFSEDVVLIDPSNGGEYRGLDQVMRYVDKMRRAFTPTRIDTKNFPLIRTPSTSSVLSSPSSATSSSPPLSSGITFEEKSLEFTGDKAIGKFHIYGSYHGKLLGSAKNAHVMVDCESVVDITFADGSAKIKELVVSNDLLGLFQSLEMKLETLPDRETLLPSTQHDGFASDASANIASDDTTEESSADFNSVGAEASELDLRKREHILAELRGLFELDDLEEASRLAQKILADRCVFVDSNMGTDHRGVEECFAYIRRLKSAFPRMKIVEERYDRDVKSPGESIRIEWLVDACYGGRLASQQAPKPCTLQGTLFLSMKPEQGEVISHLAMSWNATSLLRELGVQLRESRMGTKRPSTAS